MGRPRRPPPNPLRAGRISLACHPPWQNLWLSCWCSLLARSAALLVALCAGTLGRAWGARHISNAGPAALSLPRWRRRALAAPGSGGALPGERVILRAHFPPAACARAPARLAAGRSATEATTAAAAAAAAVPAPRHAPSHASGAGAGIHGGSAGAAQHGERGAGSAGAPSQPAGRGGTPDCDAVGAAHCGGWEPSARSTGGFCAGQRGRGSQLPPLPLLPMLL